jgi:hypothetical protein
MADLGPREELRQRIAAKLRPLTTDEEALAEAFMDAVMPLFYDVQDEWDRVDTTRMGSSGEEWLDQRWLVARIPVQSQAYERKPDRTVRP